MIRKHDLGDCAFSAPSPVASGARKRSPAFGRLSTIAGELLAIFVLVMLAVMA